jgi:hypothetical protein
MDTPYETQPSVELLIAAASSVVDLVLSRPTKLREGYLSDQVRLLTTDATFLDDLQESVSAYAAEVFRKADDGLHLWFLQKLWREHERITGDPIQALFDRRCTWFSRAYLEQCLDTLLPGWEAVIDLTSYPKALSLILGNPGLFPHLTPHAQDIIVAKLLSQSTTLGEGLRLTRELNAAGVLSERQRDRFSTAIESASLYFLVSSGYQPIYYIDRIINELKSHNWYIQNPAIEALGYVGPSGIASLPADKQLQLGNNVLQAAEGSAKSAIAMLRGMASNQVVWPEKFVEGILAECFVNEDNRIRFKINHFEYAIKSIIKLENITNIQIITHITDRIRSGVPKNSLFNLVDRDRAVETIDRQRVNDDATRELLEPLRVALLNLRQEEALADG